jgi:tetrahydromethanopterin S-methyltransferase subunit A
MEPREIPGGLRDEFSFSAQVPANPTTIAWKAYQTYADGETVAWDADPKTIASHEDSDGDEDHETAHPYSETIVINDLVKTPVASTKTEGTTINNALTIGYIALALAAIALGLQLKRNNQNLQNKTRKT